MSEGTTLHHLPNEPSISRRDRGLARRGRAAIQPRSRSQLEFFSFRFVFNPPPLHTPPPPLRTPKAVNKNNVSSLVSEHLLTLNNNRIWN
jgi:hypothetical protein